MVFRTGGMLPVVLLLIQPFLLPSPLLPLHSPLLHSRPLYWLLFCCPTNLSSPLFAIYILSPALVLPIPLVDLLWPAGSKHEVCRMGVKELMGSLGRDSKRRKTSTNPTNLIVFNFLFSSQVLIKKGRLEVFNCGDPNF